MGRHSSKVMRGVQRPEPYGRMGETHKVGVTVIGSEFGVKVRGHLMGVHSSQTGC